MDVYISFDSILTHTHTDMDIVFFFFSFLRKWQNPCTNFLVSYLKCHTKYVHIQTHTQDEKNLFLQWLAVVIRKMWLPTRHSLDKKWKWSEKENVTEKNAWIFDDIFQIQFAIKKCGESDACPNNDVILRMWNCVHCDDMSHNLNTSTYRIFYGFTSVCAYFFRTPSMAMACANIHSVRICFTWKSPENHYYIIIINIIVIIFFYYSLLKCHVLVVVAFFLDGRVHTRIGKNAFPKNIAQWLNMMRMSCRLYRDMKNTYTHFRTFNDFISD